MAKANDNADLIEAIRDLTRVTIALNAEFASTADAVRHLSSLGIPPTRVALLLGIEPKAVTSVLSKAKKRKASKREPR